MPTDSGLVQTLELAREAEKESLKRYLDFTWQNTDPGGKNMFVRLALDEYSHLELIDAQLTAACSPQGCRAQEVPESLVELLVPRLSDKTKRIRGSAGQDELDALLAALDAENRAREFYSTQAQEVLEPTRALFLRLAKMEQAHADLLQAEIDNIRETGFWFTLREFTLETER